MITLLCENKIFSAFVLIYLRMITKIYCIPGKKRKKIKYIHIYARLYKHKDGEFNTIKIV